MYRLLVAHLRNDCPTARVVIGQTVEVRIEVLANLAFGLGDEAKTPFVAEHTACRTDSKRPCVPYRAEFARRLTEFLETLLAPSQVIEFLVSCVLHLRLDRRIARDRRMALVKALRRDFASVIDAHETGGMRFLPGVKRTFVDVCCRILPRCRAGPHSDRTQGIVGTHQ